VGPPCRRASGTRVSLGTSLAEMTAALPCGRPPAMRRLAPFSVAALFVTTLAGCAGGGSSPSGAIAHPAGDALILRIATEGGFLPPGATFSQVPGLSVYGDGRIIEPGAVAAVFPGPVLPPLLVRRLSEAGIQAILREVTATG